MVGDSVTDVGLARAAGMRVILREGGYTTQPAAALGADAAIDHLCQLPAIIDHLDHLAIA